MAFKPEIDFTLLLEQGVLKQEQLKDIFGRDPTDSDLRWCVESFKSQHPDKASLVRTERRGTRRVYLMPPGYASDYRCRRVLQTASTHNTAVDLLVRVPTAELSDDERRRHRLASDVATQSKISTMSQLRKALPGQKER